MPMMNPRATESGVEARREAVVILCRGESRRLGRPKALASIGTDPRPLLRRVAERYVGCLDASVLVVTFEEMRQACEALVADLTTVRVVCGSVGGDTARTLGLAWDHLRGLEPPCSHVWVHPVDLPLVGVRTIAQLGAVSAAAPLRVVRPTWAGQPGHPVILPAPLLGLLAGEALRWPGSWRELMNSAVGDGRVAPPLTVAVADPGIVLDHDRADDGL
jgi:CTP:molybdopterin cytidylyltransferase MocA